MGAQSEHQHIPVGLLPRVFEAPPPGHEKHAMLICQHEFVHVDGSLHDPFHAIAVLALPGGRLSALGGSIWAMDAVIAVKFA